MNLTKPISDSAAGFLLRLLTTVSIMTVGAVAGILWNVNAKLASLDAQLAAIDKRLDRVDRIVDLWERERYRRMLEKR